MKKILLLFVVFVLSVMGAIAQTDLPSVCEVALPRSLAPDLLKDKDIQNFLKSSDWGQSNKTKSYWKVYSDRANNVTYTSPSDKSGRFATLNLNDELRIAKIQNGYALVYIEQYTAAIYPHINKPVSKGWVPMNHLLLWSSCPADEKGIYHKAFPLVNADEFLKTRQNGAEKEMGKVFDNPIAKSNPKNLKTGMEFYFVMKEDKESGMVLLSRRTRLTGLTDANSQFLYGWVSKASYVLWNSRLCLEPNWVPEVVEGLRNAGVNFIEIYNRQGDLSARVPFGIENHLGQESTKYRMLPSMMRFPLLGDTSESDNRYCILAYASTGDSDPKALEVLRKYFGDSTSLLGNGLYGFQGYTDIKDSLTGLYYWKPVVYISKAEYDDLMAKLQPVMAAAEEGREDRRPYVEAMKELIRTLYGNIDEMEMMLMDKKQVMALVAGLRVLPESLKGKTLEEIQDYKVVGDEEYASLMENFQQHYRRLDKIRSGFYRYSTTINGESWYWIPVEDLP